MDAIELVQAMSAGIAIVLFMFWCGGEKEFVASVLYFLGVGFCGFVVVLFALFVAGWLGSTTALWSSVDYALIFSCVSLLCSVALLIRSLARLVAVCFGK